MHVTPYLDFSGRCEEAINFYKAALGAQVTMLSRFKEGPPGMAAPEVGDKILHVAFRVGDTELMASDAQCTGHASFAGISLSLTANNVPEAERWFAALSDGGKVTMPMAKTFFAERFGMLVDRFGVPWMVVQMAG